MFNLIPIWQLDGSRGLRSLTRTQRGIVLAAAFGLWAVAGAPMLALVALGCGYRMFTNDWERSRTQPGLMHSWGSTALAVVFALSAGAAAVRAG